MNILTHHKSNSLKALGQQYDKATVAILRRKNIRANIKHVTRGARYIGIGYRLADSTQLKTAIELTDPISIKTGNDSVISMFHDGLIWYHFGLPPEFVKTYALSDLDPGNIGIGDNEQQINFVEQELFTEANGNPMTSLVGEPGSGKTTLMQVILLSLMRLRQPDRLGLVIGDYKNDLKPFTNSVYLKQPIATNVESVSRLIQWTAGEVRQRAENDIKDPDKLLILAIDEVKELSDADFRLLDNVISLGRSVFVWAIIGTQTPGAGFRKIYPNLSNRFAGKVGQGESYNITRVARLNADRLLGRGDFVRVNKYDPTRFQVPMVTARDFDYIDRAEPPPIQIIEVLPPIMETRADTGRGRPAQQLDLDILATYVSFALRNKPLPVGCADYLFKWSESQPRSQYYQHKVYGEAAARFVRIITATNNQPLCKGKNI